MDKLFLTVLNMSLTGALVIVAICLARLPLKKAPKIISYCLWAVAGFRLVFPFSIESIFSLMPIKPQPIPIDIAMQAVPRIDSGIPFMNNAVSSVLPVASSADSANPLQIWTFISSCVWIIVVAAMVVYSVVSFIILKRKMQSAAHVEANIYEAENLKSPFVLGIFKPKIYLPVGLSEYEREYILLHEQTHIKRHDHIIKYVAYFILCLHWFNPLAWIAFLLMGEDMEMSCDERVMKDRGSDICDDYSMSLVRIATGRRILNGSPLAFGEGGMKERINRVLNFKKPSRVIIVAAVALVAVLSVGFAFNRIVNEPLIEMKMVYEENPAFFLKDMRLVWDDTIYYVIPMNNTGQGKEIGYATDEYSTWRIYELNGYNRDYLLAVESEDVWRVMSIHPLNNHLQQYILENATEKQRAERMLSVTLYNDGTARLATPPISSYAMVETVYYSFENDELLIGYKNNNLIENPKIEPFAIFTVADDNTLVFKSATVPLFADKGARYVLTPSSTVPTATYEPRKWVDFYRDVELPWTSTYDLVLDEFPGVTFNWTSEKVTATHNNDIKDLFMGMPVWNVYLADLNGDRLPEICATISIGSGIVDTRIAVYDYANDTLFDLSDRMSYDYSLSIDDRQLVVTQTRYSESGSQVTGSMAIINGELATFGIDRTLFERKSQETTPLPAEYLSPTEIVRQELLKDGYKITYVFLMSQGDRKSLQDVDNGELAVVYVSYTEGEYGDAIYCMRYDFERATQNSQWTHSEPTFWDGIAVDVAAYVARSYYAEQTGSDYGSLVVTWAGQGEIETLPNTEQSNYAAFYIGTGDDVPSSIILTSPDGQSHWKVVGYDGADVTR